MWQDNDPKHSKHNKRLPQGRWKVLDRPSQSPDHIPTEQAFHLLKRRQKVKSNN